MRSKNLLQIMILVFSFFFSVNCMVFGQEIELPWKPDRPITCYIGFAAGGGTDRTIRVLAGEMSKILGQQIIIQNTPGATSSIGFAQVAEAPHDGYTWFGSAYECQVIFPVMNFHTDTHRDWIHWLATFSVTLVSVPVNSEVKTFNDFLKAKDLSVGSAGVGASDHVALEVLTRVTDFEYTHVPYSGGAPAMTATISGEVDATLQNIIVIADHIKAGNLRPIVAFSTEPFHMPGTPWEVVPPITDYLPEIVPLMPMGAQFGLSLPKDVPADVVKTIDIVFMEAIKSKAISDLAEERYLLVPGLIGDEAMKWLDRIAEYSSWVLYEEGIAEISPEKFNIKKPW